MGYTKSYLETNMDPKTLEDLGNGRLGSKSLADLKEEGSSLKKLSKKHFDLLDDISKDVIELYYFRGVYQQQIADLFNVTQGNISTLLKKLRNYLAWADKIPEKPKSFEEDCRKAFERQRSISPRKNYDVAFRLKCVHTYLKTLHQCQTAFELKTNQPAVRYSLMQCLKGLEALKLQESYDHLHYFLKDGRVAPWVNCFKSKMDISKSRPKSYFHAAAARSKAIRKSIIS